MYKNEIIGSGLSDETYSPYLSFTHIVPLSGNGLQSARGLFGLSGGSGLF